MKLRHQEEIQKLKEKLNNELKNGEDVAMNDMDAETQRKMRQIKDRHAAEISARSNAMTPEELQRVIRSLSFFNFVYWLTFSKLFTVFISVDTNLATCCFVSINKTTNTVWLTFSILFTVFIIVDTNLATCCTSTRSRRRFRKTGLRP